MNDLILRAEGIYKYFFDSHYGKKTVIKAVNGVDVGVRRRETLAIVGESGSGKTTLGKVLMRIYEPTEGKIWFEGNEISTVNGSKLKAYRKYMQMVFQDPTSSLNPRKRIFDIISLPLKAHFNMSKRERLQRVRELLNKVDLPEDFIYRYPNALSGGQKQRVGIARALALNPKLIVLDEPTSALDVSVQAKILTLLTQLKEQFDLTYIFISHDLSVVKNISDKIVVMYLGYIMESASTEEIFNNPYHPYTKALLSAIPTVTDEERKIIPEEITLQGDIPSPSHIPQGCPFYSRCQERMDICKIKRPRILQIKEGHYVRCFLYDRNGGK